MVVAHDINGPNRSEQWMRHALQLARYAASSGEVPVGAVIVDDDEETLLAEGWNCPITSCDPSAHAEIVALRRAATKLKNYRINNTTLYVTLEPCIMCVGAMIQARISRLVFGAADPKAGAVISVFNILDETTQGKLNHKIVYNSGVLADECGAILTHFFKERRR